MPAFRSTRSIFVAAAVALAAPALADDQSPQVIYEASPMPPQLMGSAILFYGGILQGDSYIGDYKVLCGLNDNSSYDLAYSDLMIADDKGFRRVINLGEDTIYVTEAQNGAFPDGPFDVQVHKKGSFVSLQTCLPDDKNGLKKCGANQAQRTSTADVLSASQNADQLCRSKFKELATSIRALHPGPDAEQTRQNLSNILNGIRQALGIPAAR